MTKNKTIVITGAANGIGRAWAESFHAEGARVFAADIDTQELESMTRMGISVVKTDVRDSHQVSDLIHQAFRDTGRIDALFNNAGTAYGYKVEDSVDGKFEDHIAIHLFGCLYGMSSALPLMKNQGSGRIINTVSRNAEIDIPGTSAYSAAKAAVWAASRVAAREVSNHDILINMLIPGPTNTKIWGKDRPDLQAPKATFPTAKMLATLPVGGPTGRVFWNQKEYKLFNLQNDIRRDL